MKWKNGANIALLVERETMLEQSSNEWWKNTSSLRSVCFANNIWFAKKREEKMTIENWELKRIKKLSVALNGVKSIGKQKGKRMVYKSSSRKTQATANMGGLNSWTAKRATFIFKYVYYVYLYVHTDRVEWLIMNKVEPTRYFKRETTNLKAI